MQGLLKGSYANDIFDVIWNNINLRNDLFKPSDYPLGLTNAIGLIDFNRWVQDFEPKIFIIVETN